MTKNIAEPTMASIRLIGGNSTTPLVDRRQSFHNQVKDCLSLGSNGEVSARTKHISEFRLDRGQPGHNPILGLLPGGRSTGRNDGCGKIQMLTMAANDEIKPTSDRVAVFVTSSGCYIRCSICSPSLAGSRFVFFDFTASSACSCSPF